MRIGVIYSLVDEVKRGKESDKIADNEVLVTARAVRNVLMKSGHEVDLVRLNKDLSVLLHCDYDVIFNLAEGVDGDSLFESKIAAVLQRLGILFSGNSAEALALCLDKAETKKILLENNVLTPKYQIFDNCNQELNSKMSFPLIAKPVHEDASIGISTDSVVFDFFALRKKVSEILDLYKQPVLVEEFIDGREINVALLENGNFVEVLPMSEIIFNYPENIPRVVSFDAKWLESSEAYNNSVVRCPADLDKSTQEAIKTIALNTYKLMGCSDYARIDFRLKDGLVYVLEVNPNPCINPNDSGFVRSAKAAGYNYNELINKIFSNTLCKYNRVLLSLQ